jgi:putative ABC transport system permease protein
VSLGICGLRPGMLLYLMRRRLRAHPGAELLAALGVAVGVALVFGVLLANSSLTSSAAKLVHALTGDARFELTSPSSQGFSQSIAERAGTLSGVEIAAPVLRRDVTLRTAHGSESVQLIGLSPSVEDLGGASTQELAAGAQLLKGGVGLPRGVASTLGVGRDASVLLASGGRQTSAQVRALLGGSLAPLASSPVVVAVLANAQRLAGAGGVVSAVLVRPLPGHAAQVRRELRSLAGSRLQVRPADAELGLLGVATQPSRQSTSLFTAIAVMIGFLLALNAVLLTLPERRRFVADLQLQGYAPRQIALLLGVQAAAVGLLSSMLGVGIGYLLAKLLFQRAPDFLAAAFPVGAEQSVRPLAVLAAIACGVGAAMLASLGPAVDLHRRGDRREQPLGREQARGEQIAAGTATRLAITGLVLIALALALALLSPALTIFGGVSLALATVCLVPAALAGVVRLLPPALERLRSAALVVALQELRAVTVRGAALTAIVALALYGAIAIGGAREDLLRGIGQATRQYFSTAPAWVSAGRDVFNMNAFPAGGPSAVLARLPQVATVRVYRGGLLDVGQRRMWVRARPAGDSLMLEPSQVLHGRVAVAQARIRDGGWAAVSSSYADEAHLRAGQSFTLPTPAGPRTLRLAAITTNSGWPPGTITLAASDYARWWGADAAALEVSFRPGVSAPVGTRAVQAALAGSFPGLLAQTAVQRAAQSEASARRGLRTLQEISSLLLLAAALAVACALAASIWQRRRRLASLKLQGYGSGQLWGAIVTESGVTLAVGASLGGALGVGGHALASRFLALSTGFPAPFSFGWAYVLLTLAAFCAIALAVIALPGMLAARVPAQVALQEG